jgi:hypothetical protein
VTFHSNNIKASKYWGKKHTDNATVKCKVRRILLDKQISKGSEKAIGMKETLDHRLYRTMNYAELLRKPTTC